MSIEKHAVTWDTLEFVNADTDNLEKVNNDCNHKFLYVGKLRSYGIVNAITTLRSTQPNNSGRFEV